MLFRSPHTKNACYAHLSRDAIADNNARIERLEADLVVNMLEITKQEPVNDAAMFDAAFRLALVLNKIF